MFSHYFVITLPWWPFIRELVNTICPPFVNLSFPIISDFFFFLFDISFSELLLYFKNKNGSIFKIGIFILYFYLTFIAEWSHSYDVKCVLNERWYFFFFFTDDVSVVYKFIRLKEFDFRFIHLLFIHFYGFIYTAAYTIV